MRFRLRGGAAGAPALPPAGASGAAAGRAASAFHALGLAVDVIAVDRPGVQTRDQRALTTVSRRQSVGQRRGWHSAGVWRYCSPCACAHLPLHAGDRWITMLSSPKYVSAGLGLGSRLPVSPGLHAHRCRAAPPCHCNSTVLHGRATYKVNMPRMHADCRIFGRWSALSARG